MTSWPWTLMVNGISSLQPKACTFVFCLGMLLHLQLSPIWEQEALAVQQGDIVSKNQISEGALAKRHTNRAWFNSPVQQPIHACGKWVWGQHTALASTSLDFKPWDVSPTCQNTTNRVVVQHSKESHNLIWDTKSPLGNYRYVGVSLMLICTLCRVCVVNDLTSCWWCFVWVQLVVIYHGRGVAHWRPAQRADCCHLLRHRKEKGSSRLLKHSLKSAAGRQHFRPNITLSSTFQRGPESGHCSVH